MKLRVVFYRSGAGNEPVKDWLRSLDREDRRALGEDIKTVELGWPLGMPLVRSLGDGLWEVRSRLRGGVARVVFLARDDMMVLLHGFVKKSPKTPKKELDVARRRARDLTGGEG
jgi:phage-related protein